MKKLLILPGDGIGPEVMEQARAVLEKLRETQALAIDISTGLVGGAAVDVAGDPCPAATLAQAREADAILFGAIGGPKWDNLERDKRPEAGLLRLRSELGLFANLRPAVVHDELRAASALKPELVSGLDLLIVRELTGGIYFGQPRGIRDNAGQREGFNTLVYSQGEVERIVRVALEAARKRGKRLCSVDKANVLEASGLWREVVDRVARDYPDIQVSHMYVDNAAMQLVREPKQFDVIVTSNMFGDILSDIAAQLTGSIGMLPSASLDADNKGMYEPVHGSAPDIAGQGVANPLAAILSAAMMLRFSLDRADLADRIENAVASVLRRGLRTTDLARTGEIGVGTQAMGAAVADLLD